MKVLSLFDGMSCAMLALLAQGIQVDKYVAYEIDKYAIQTATHNFPMIEQKGDVFKADFTEHKGFDYVMGGSPCTYWSIAQKNNRETEASGMGWELFSQFVRAIKEAEPKYFVYENNKSMSKAIRQSITDTFGFEPICINSALVSAQNRQRLYWVGKRNADGTYSKVNVEQPEDRGILLKDILVGSFENMPGPACVAQRGRYTDTGRRDVKGTGPIEQYYEAREDGKTNTLTTVQKDNYIAEPVRIPEYGSDNKSRPVTHSYSKQGCGQLDKNVFPTNPCKQLYDYICEPIRIPPYGNEDKARPLNAYYSNNCGGFEQRMFSENPNKQQVDMVAEPVRAGAMPRPNGELSTSQSGRVYSIEGKAVNLTSGGGGAGAKTGLYAVPVPTYVEPCEWDEEGKPIKAISYADGKVYQVYEVKDGLITINGKQYPIKLADGFYIIRKLTVRECMRLQTVPEEYEFPVSDSQAYKMLGNGWTVDVIAHILNYIK